MRIGINGSSHIALASPLESIAEHSAKAEQDGLGSYWLAQLTWPDSLTAIAAIASRTSHIRFGTAVVPTWPRHPLMLAAQALTTSHATGGRVTLGIGLAHESMVEQTFGVPFDRPARHMAEYLDVLLPAMDDHVVDSTGDIWSAHSDGFGVATDTPTPRVVLAAMGPRMLDLAGSRTDGTILWLSGPRTIETRIRPALDAAAERAGRGRPEVIASVPICVTSDRPKVHAMVAETLSNYNDLPSYRRVMDTEGAEGPADVSLIGSEAEVRAGLQAFADAGTTEFSALEFTTNDDEAAATRALLMEFNSPG
ncbi:MAG: TIGR03564 family F420-dependent LLM class oxidoreductase [Microthrixaceae bacterium]|nr:TIGR03564 family F420-dependent LLM class oxidoreductase [Microthrixaceae bacterium]